VLSSVIGRAPTPNLLDDARSMRAWVESVLVIDRVQRNEPLPVINFLGWALLLQRLGEKIGSRALQLESLELSNMVLTREASESDFEAAFIIPRADQRPRSAPSVTLNPHLAFGWPFCGPTVIVMRTGPIAVGLV
jgi:hypothetical protein